MLEMGVREPTHVETQEGINQSSFSSHTQTYSTRTCVIIKVMFCNVKEYLSALPDIRHASSWPEQAVSEHKVAL